MFNATVDITKVPWQTARFDAERGWIDIETVERGDDLPDQGYTLAKVYVAKADAPVASLIAAAPRLLATLLDVELRTTQARIASTIGKRSGQQQANFLRGELERIALVVRAEIDKAKEERR